MLTKKGIGKRLLKRNWNITVFSVVSVLIGTMLILEMFILLLNTNRAYENDMKALYGECDVGIYYSDYTEINDLIVHTLEQSDYVISLSAICYADDMNISNSSPYVIGTDNSDMVRSRYHFNSSLGENQVAVNKIFAEILQCDVGERVTVGETQLEIVEIFDDGTLSDTAVEMLVIHKDTLEKLCGEAATNIIMLQIKEGIENAVEELIRGMDSELNVLVFGTDEAYLKAVNSFAVYIVILAVCVIMATCLFTATVFKNLLYKYRKEMAVLRMIGATPEQIKYIFIYMLRRIILLGVTTGLILVLILNFLFINSFNEKWQLIEGEIELFYGESILICAGIYCVIRIILQVIASHFNKILPMEAMGINEKSVSGKMKDRKIRRIGGKDFYISFKLISTRLKENILVIATIALLVIISVFGASLGTVIKANGERYYKELYLVETVLTSSVSMDYAESRQLYTEIQQDKDVTVSCVYSGSYPVTINDKSFGYGLVDIAAFVKQGTVPQGEYGENSVILSQSNGEYLQCKVGDNITITSPRVYEFGADGLPTGAISQEEQEHVFQVAAILPDAFFYGCGMYLDVSQQKFINDGVWFSKLYIDGEKDNIEHLLNGMRNRYPSIKWTYYTDAIKANSKGIDDRLFILQIVVKTLVLIATIGWVNSIKNIFHSRIRDYTIIRMQGVGAKRTLKILIYQILIYLSIGLIIGFACAVLLLEILMYIEQRRLIFQFNLEILKYMICVMLTSCVILIPTLKRICTKNTLLQSP